MLYTRNALAKTGAFLIYGLVINYQKSSRRTKATE